MAEVYRTLLDIGQRDQWISGVRETEHDGTVPRLGLVHVCRLEGTSVELQTVGSEVGESEIVYVEERWIKEIDLTIRETFVLKSLVWCLRSSAAIRSRVHPLWTALELLAVATATPRRPALPERRLRPLDSYQTSETPH